VSKTRAFCKCAALLCPVVGFEVWQMAHFGPLVQSSLLPQDESRVPHCSWNSHLLHVLRHVPPICSDWTPCHRHNPFSLRTFQHFLVLLNRETFFLASTHNQNNPMLIQSLFKTYLHLLCLLLLQDAQQNLRQNAQFIRLTVAALPTQLP
jgi:hypothetical protein